MLREIILDTETTGLSPKAGHRIVEIGCVELINHIPTGKHFHAYINPERDVPLESTAITGLTYNFLKDHKVFAEVVDGFLAFIGEDRLVIHNAAFDLSFLNAELNTLKKPLLPEEKVTDTLALARKKFPGSPASLDALCKRFQIDLSKREKHGALLDSYLLAQVYLELLGGRQRKLGINKNTSHELSPQTNTSREINFPKRFFELNSMDQQAHQKFIAGIKNNLWMKNRNQEPKVRKQEDAHCEMLTSCISSIYS
jgi:DNA polymerase-3 subunit epsilon